MLNFLKHSLGGLCEKDFHENFEKFTWKHLCQGLFFNKVASGACNFNKNRLWHRCFPLNIAKFLGTRLSKEHL